MKKKTAKKIVFVCTGNTCRSPMAEILLKAELKKRNLKGFEVCSAGIAAKAGDTLNSKSAQVLSEAGLAFEKFSSTLLTGSILTDAFAVICMTEKQRDYLMDARWNLLREKGVEEIENNVYSFSEISGYDVLDPYGQDIDCYRYVFGLLQAGMYALIEKLHLEEIAEKAKPAALRKSSQKAKSQTRNVATATPKKRGRPKKTTAETGSAGAEQTSGVKRGRGRPKKTENQ